MMDSSYYDLNSILSYYSIILAIFGTIGNILACITCFRKKLRKVPTFVFVGFMVICDTIALYFWNFNDFLLTYHEATIGDYSLIGCKLTSVIQCVSLQASAFLLVNTFSIFYILIFF